MPDGVEVLPRGVSLEGVLRFTEVAARALEAAREEVDALNVYPVPDGDTGTNMSMTAQAAVNALADLEDGAADDLAAVIPARPGGIMLPKSRGRHDVEELDRLITPLEDENGIATGSTPVIALVTETAAAMFTTGDYGGAPRLAAMTWGAEDLADSLGAQSNKDFEGDFAFTYKLARSLCLLGAAAAEVVPVETIDTNFRDLQALRKRAIEVRRQGYRGMLAIHPAQVPVINEAFTPSDEEVAEAREIVDLFEANPGAGTIGWKGGMLDRPHLSRARQLLAQVED